MGDRWGQGFWRATPPALSSMDAVWCFCWGVSWAGVSVVRPCWNLGVVGGREGRQGPAQISAVWRGQELVANEHSQR